MSFSIPQNKRKLFILLCVCLAIVAVIQSVLYLTCYDGTVGLYQQGFSRDGLKIAYLLVAALLCLPFFFIQKSELSPADRVLSSTRATDFFALLSGASIIGTLATQLININAHDRLSILLQNPSNTNSSAQTLLMASLILALPAAIYFFGVFSQKNWVYPLLLTILWVSSYMLRVYFDTELLLMNPTRQMTLAALSAILFFLIAELRLVRGIESLRMYAVAATLTALFAGVSGIGSLLLTLLGHLPFETETVYCAFQLAIAIYALFRLKMVLVGAPVARTETVSDDHDEDNPSESNDSEESV